ncbi:MAG: TIGR02270 family protein [Myxococcota bacterium]
MTEPSADTILWDVIEEHLDEAEYLAENWRVNLDSPAYLRDEFERGPQERLLAHVDGLVVGGDPVRTEVLGPALQDEDTDPWRVTAAALALLGHDSRQVSEPLFNELDALPEPAREGVIEALVMSDRPDIDVRLTDALRRGGAAEHLVALATVGGRRGINPGNLVDALLKDGDAVARTAAVSMLGYGDRRYVTWAEHCLAKPEPELQRAALRAGLMMGSGLAWQTAGRLGLAEESPDREAMVLLCSFAEPMIIERLTRMLEVEASRADALFALGFSGRVAALDAIVPWLGDEAFGPLAGEAFASMTGLPLDDDAYWTDREDDDVEDEDPDTLEDDLDEDEDPDEDLSIAADEELRVPKADAIAAWWEERSGRFNAKLRYIAGRPADQNAIEHALRTQPMRRHHALAFELLVRSRGQANVRTRSFTHASKAALEALASLPRLDGNRSYANLG